MNEFLVLSGVAFAPSSHKAIFTAARSFALPARRLILLSSAAAVIGLFVRISNVPPLANSLKLCFTNRSSSE